MNFRGFVHLLLPKLCLELTLGCRELQATSSGAKTPLITSFVCLVESNTLESVSESLVPEIRNSKNRYSSSQHEDRKCFQRSLWFQSPQQPFDNIQSRIFNCKD